MGNETIKIYLKTFRGKEESIVLRSSAEGWKRNFKGRWIDKTGSWAFTVQLDTHPPDTEFKFFLLAEGKWGPADHELLVTRGGVSRSFTEDGNWGWTDTSPEAARQAG